MHDWNLSIPEAIELQQRLRGEVVLHPPADFHPRFIAGADVSMNRDSAQGFAGIVVIDQETMQTVEEATAVVQLGFPYVPGLLSFRELPALAPVWRQLKRRPDVVIFDGAGYAHPRRFGLACHGGLLFDTPSIGCAKTILIGAHGPLEPERGATAELIHQGEVIGMAVRLRKDSTPVYVSAGHKMDLPTAVQIVQMVGMGYREPETTRRAHRLVNELRRQANASQTSIDR